MGARIQKVRCAGRRSRADAKPPDYEVDLRHQVADGGPGWRGRLHGLAVRLDDSGPDDVGDPAPVHQRRMVQQVDRTPHRNSPMNHRDFIDCATSNLANAVLLSRLPSLALSQCYLTAGCLFQATWNRLSGQAADYGIKDYDVFYFDDRDLSWGAEDAVIRRVDALAGDLGISVETRNQARVHLWYEKRFGAGYPKLASTRDGIDRFLISCTCVGIEVASGKLYAPDGLQDLEKGILRPNPANSRADRFLEKAKDYQARWPWLTIVG